MIAYRVEALEPQVNRLRELYFHPLGTPKPAVAYEGRNIQFLMSPLNFIVERIEHPEHEHVFSEGSMSLACATPEPAAGIHLDHRRGDAMLRPKLVHSPATVGPGVFAEIIDDHEAARDQPRV